MTLSRTSSRIAAGPRPGAAQERLVGHGLEGVLSELELHVLELEDLSCTA